MNTVACAATISLVRQVADRRRDGRVLQLRRDRGNERLSRYHADNMQMRRKGGCWKQF